MINLAAYTLNPIPLLIENYNCIDVPFPLPYLELFPENAINQPPLLPWVK